MSQTIEKVCDFLIEWSFLAIFFFVPLVFTSTTSELFEFNKMWLTFILTLVIAGALATKMIVWKKFRVKRTPFDLFFLLFLFSQLISTVFSLDTHVSWLGYYSRFNGGFLSLITYVFLFYSLTIFAIEKKEEKQQELTKTDKIRKIIFFASAILIIPVSILLAAPPKGETDKALTWIFWGGTIISFILFAHSLPKAFLKRLLYIIVISGAVVALWGLPSHFGYDPTCYLFRGTLDVSCWTEAFQPKARVFSTMGQPAWLGAYFAALIPLILAFVFKKTEKRDSFELVYKIALFILSLILFADILFTGTRASIIGIGTGLFFFFSLFLLINLKQILKTAAISAGTILLFGILVFLIGVPGFSFFNKLNFQTIFQKPANNERVQTLEKTVKGPALETGGTESGTIRLNVWKGAIDAWKNNIFFGTGVETFAFAYYKYKPISHNLTSEWDFLYNKAHNEYLNYLTTTGAFGLGTYLAMIGAFLFLTFKHILSNKYDFKNDKSSIINNKSLILTAILSGYISILVTNFFGFSVVIINLFMFLYPSFVLLLSEKWSFETNTVKNLSSTQIITILTVWSLILYFGYGLYNSWSADKSYTYGHNLNRLGSYTNAYPYLKEAVLKNPSEPVFEDELSTNNATLAILMASEKDATQASQFAEAAITSSNNIIQNHPNNVVYWKSRIKILSSLGQLNPSIYEAALLASQNAKALAPTDAKISYTLGVLYLQTGDIDKAIETFRETIQLKPDYREGWYGLGLSYHTKATDKDGKIVDFESQQKAKDAMKHILSKISPTDSQAKAALKEWGE